MRETSFLYQWHDDVWLLKGHYKPLKSAQFLTVDIVCLATVVPLLEGKLPGLESMQGGCMTARVSVQGTA